MICILDEQQKMSDASVNPSGLHLKKELSALTRAKCFRDPETISTWRSPLSSRSVANTSTWILNGTRIQGHHGTGNVSDLFGTEILPRRDGSKQKKIFLHNWRQHSGNSSDSGVKIISQSRPGSSPESPQDSQNGANLGKSVDNAYLADTTSICKTRNTNFGMSTRRTMSTSKQISMSKHKPFRTSMITSIPSYSVSNCSNAELSNSLNTPLASQTSTDRLWFPSLSASPFLSSYGKCSDTSNINFSPEISCSLNSPSSRSYNRYLGSLTSTTESWNGTPNLSDFNELEQLDLNVGQGCQIRRQWLKRAMPGGCGRFSPSFSDRLRRTGCGILCGSRPLSSRSKKSPAACKEKSYLHSTHSLPLLSNTTDDGNSATDSASDELSTNFGELELEAFCRLDGRRWSSCRSQDGLDIASKRKPHNLITKNRIIFGKYSPFFFDDLVGQHLIIQSLKTSILRGKVSPLYLFEGPRGTGKTSAARIFSAALNCLSIKEEKPCKSCSECINFASGNSTHLLEMSASNKTGLKLLRDQLKNLSEDPPFSRFKIFVIDECHMLPPDIWPLFINFVKKAPVRVIFIFVTTATNSMPPIIIFRCRRYYFSKIKDFDIVTRLKQLVSQEKLDADIDALGVIASCSDGSLRDAVSLLEQLSLLDRRITKELVNDLVGIVPDEKLLDLLELAMSSNISKTVKRARELLNSGVDPTALMSQLASLIMDIIAGTSHLNQLKCNDAAKSLTKAELKKLRSALKVLSQAEKQLQHSTERSTWFTAALLQLGSKSSVNSTSRSSNRKQWLKQTREVSPRAYTETSSPSRSDCCDPEMQGPKANTTHTTPNSHISSSVDHSSIDFSHDALDINLSCICQDKTGEIWRRCIRKCHSGALRHLLQSHSELVSILEVDGNVIAYVAFWNKDSKSQAENFLSSITDLVEIVLKRKVQVKLELISNGRYYVNKIHPFEAADANGQGEKIQAENVPNVKGNEANNFCDQVLQKELIRTYINSFENISDGSYLPHRSLLESSLPHILKENEDSSVVYEDAGVNLAQEMHGSMNEENMKNDHFQEVGENILVSTSQFIAEKHRGLQQGDIHDDNQKPNESMASLNLSFRQKENNLNNDIKSFKDNMGTIIHQNQQNHQMGECCSISPSLLHTGNFSVNLGKENLENESASGCYSILCWKSAKPSAVRVKSGAHARLHWCAQFSVFGQCRKPKREMKIEDNDNAL